MSIEPPRQKVALNLPFHPDSPSAPLIPPYWNTHTQRTGRTPLLSHSDKRTPCKTSGFQRTSLVSRQISPSRIYFSPQHRLFAEPGISLSWLSFLLPLGSPAGYHRGGGLTQGHPLPEGSGRVTPAYSRELVLEGVHPLPAEARAGVSKQFCSMAASALPDRAQDGDQNSLCPQQSLPLHRTPGQF